MFGLSLSFFAFNIQAQALANKKIQAGLLTGFGLNFQKMKTNRLQTNGVGSDFMFGTDIIVALNKKTAFNVGLGLNFESLKYKANSNSLYYLYRGNHILRLNENHYVINAIGNTDSVKVNNYFKLDERKQNLVYLTIPTMLVLRSNFIGYTRCFGKLGLRTSILLSNKSTDIGSLMTIEGSSIGEKEQINHDMKSKGEQFIIKSAAGFSCGVEWNFIGGIALIGEIGYFYGLTPLYNKRAFFTDANGLFANKATQSQLQLKASILF
ncbi:MAG: outer membrane beta-barrel protein [Crocinitomicaceae bacterium]|nr:outer membrane beta-barrel protein [Crocinitomicaceae bacterium]MDG1776439.1 outer membrane beta-barrel protein [Crocinitomicaceae bacterium]